MKSKLAYIDDITGKQVREKVKEYSKRLENYKDLVRKGERNPIYFLTELN